MYNQIRTTIAGILSLMFVILPPKAKAQCYTASYRNGTSFTTVNPGSYNFDFANLSNLSTSNNSYASAASIVTLLVGNTYYLKATGFGFTIPSYASICGVTVQIEKRANGLGLWSTLTDNQVRIVKGGTILGHNKASGAAWADSKFTSTYGGASDLWGTTLTPEDVNAANFGIAISVHIEGVLVTPSAQVDVMRISIEYNPVLPITLAYFNANKANNKAHLEWKTTEEEDNAYISVQRSFNNENNWQELKRYELNSQNHDKVYKYEDASLDAGKYAYRLKMVTGTGATTYSAVKTITSTNEKTIAVYPNPASNFIIVDGASTEKEIIITDALARKWVLPINRTGATTAQVNIQSLPRGIYFISNGIERGKFIKD